MSDALGSLTLGTSLLSSRPCKRGEHPLTYLGNGPTYASNFSTPASSVLYTPASSVSYMPGTPGFGFPQGATPVMMGGMFSPQHFGTVSPSQFGTGTFSPFVSSQMGHQAYGSNMMSFGPRANGYNSPRHVGGDPRYFDDMMVAGPREDNYGRFNSGRGRFGGRQIGYRGRGNQVGGQHNHVEIDKIQAGLDVRTTVG